MNQFVKTTIRVPGEDIYVDIALNGAEPIRMGKIFSRSIKPLDVIYQWASEDRTDLMIGIEQLW